MSEITVPVFSTVGKTVVKSQVYTEIQSANETIRRHDARSIVQLSTPTFSVDEADECWATILSTYTLPLSTNPMITQKLTATILVTRPTTRLTTHTNMVATRVFPKPSEAISWIPASTNYATKGTTARPSPIMAPGLPTAIKSSIGQGNYPFVTPSAVIPFGDVSTTPIPNSIPATITSLNGKGGISIVVLPSGGGVLLNGQSLSLGAITTWNGITLKNGPLGLSEVSDSKPLSGAIHGLEIIYEKAPSCKLIRSACVN